MTEPNDSNVILINRLCARKILQKTCDTEFLVYVILRFKKKKKKQHTGFLFVSRLSKKMTLPAVNFTDCDLRPQPDLILIRLNSETT